MLLFESKINEEIKNDIVRTTSSYSKENWRHILEDKFVFDSVIQKMDAVTVTMIAENVIKDVEKSDKLNIPQHVSNSTILINSINWVVLVKMNKMICKKNITPELLSAKIFSTLPDDLFLIEVDYQEIIVKIKEICTTKNGNRLKNFDFKINENKLCRILEIAKNFPIIFSHNGSQKIFLLYLCALHRDLSQEFSNRNFVKLQLNIENFIIGMF